MTITTVRPNATTSAGGYTATGAATLQAATSDDSDASYIARSGAATEAVIPCAATASAGKGLHLFRGRVRAVAASGTPIGSVLFYVRPDATAFPADFTNVTAVLSTTPVTIEGPWLPPNNYTPPTSANVYSRVVTNAGTDPTVRYLEFYVDEDFRSRPTFTPDVRDGLGVSKAGGTITNTSRAALIFGAISNDSLVARTWSVTIEDTGTSLVVYTANGTGIPPASILSDPLPNGNYKAHFSSSSTIQTNTQWDSAVYDVTFAVNYVPLSPPASVTATLGCVTGAPSVGISWADPASGGAWDSKPDVVAEIRRTDCDGTVTVAVIEAPAISGTWCDRFMAFMRPEACESPGCDDSTVYEVRYWGKVGGIVVSTAWSAAAGVDVVNTSPGADWIRGPLSGDMAICPDIGWGRVRPFSAGQPIGGGYPVVNTGAPGGRNYKLTIATRTHQELLDLEAILANSMVHYTPADPLQPAGWFAPSDEGVGRPKVKSVHVTDVTLTGVEAEPLANPADLL